MYETNKKVSAMPITAIYAALLAILGVGLSVYVSVNRGTYAVALGDGGNAQLQLIIRRHANFTESVPLALIVLGLAEAGGLSPLWLHGVGGLLLASRLIHPFGLSFTNPTSLPRVAGAVGTSVATGIAAGAILLQTLN